MPLRLLVAGVILVAAGCSSKGRPDGPPADGAETETAGSDGLPADSPENDAPAEDAADAALSGDAADAAPSTDAAPSADAADAAPSADAADAAPSADAADAAVCPSIDAFCATDASTGPNLNGRCVRDWATAKMAAAWCPTTYNISIHSGCNGYDFVVQGGIDTSYFYAYDDATGDLVSVWFNGARGSTCVAGITLPADPAACSDGGLRGPSICSADAGGG